MYLLDTVIVSNFRKRKPHPNLVAWLDRNRAEDIAIAAITVFEIQAGINLLREGEPAKAEDIRDWLDGFVLAGEFAIIPFNAGVARVYADMFTTPALKTFLMPDARSRKPKSGADLHIAATAIVHGAVVVSADIEDFRLIHSHFPLPGLYDPFNENWAVGSL